MTSTEAINALSRDIDLKSSEEICRLINQEDRTVAAAVGQAIGQIARAVDCIAERLDGGGKLLYVGAGTSGRIGILDAVECPPTFGIPPYRIGGLIAGGYAACYSATEASEDDRQQGARDLESRNISAGDVVVGLAASGGTPYTCGAVERAGQLGAATIGVSCNRGTELSRLAQIPIEVEVGPEIVAGSTRMKAGTAQKLIVNMLSTGAMIRLGMVYSYWMINVQPTNEKLRSRARRILQEVASLNSEEASELLQRAGDLRVALVMSLRGVDREGARRLLAGGKLRQALRQQ